MAVPVEDTVAVGDKVTAALWNSDARDAINFLLDPPRAWAYRTTTQSVASVTWTLLSMDAEAYDTDSIHDTVTNNSRMTVKTAGRYWYHAFVTWVGNATGGRTLMARKNSAGASGGGSGLMAAMWQGTTLHANSIHLQGETETFAVNDYFEVFFDQGSGGALSTDVATYGAQYSLGFQMRWVGP